VDFELAVVAGESFGVVNDAKRWMLLPAPSPVRDSSSLAVWLEAAATAEWIASAPAVSNVSPVANAGHGRPVPVIATRAAAR